MHPMTRAASIAAALLFAAPAAAQQTPPSDPDIIVSGERIDRAERERQVREFVGALTPAPAGTIPRFLGQVCPAVAGLTPSQNRKVADRLREVASAAQIEVAGSGCVPNAIVIVTADKRDFIETLALKQPNYFGELTARQIRRLARSPGPAAAWQLEGPVDADGTPMPRDERLGYINWGMVAATRIRPAGRRAFDGAVLVVERPALVGLTSVQLADYAAMRLFAKLDPARLTGAPPPTILTVLEAPMGSAIPITMTDWDLGLLRGLYISAPLQHPSGQRTEIQREVTQALEAPEPGRD